MSVEADMDGNAFADELARVRSSGVLGESGRLVELFEYLAARGPLGEAASQAEIAEAVFGQAGGDSDDATVRVYIHRLRKRLEEFYANDGDAEGGARLAVPTGTYALRLAAGNSNHGKTAGRSRKPWLVALVGLVLVTTFLAGRMLAGSPAAGVANSIWQPFIESDRPLVIAVGDYYIYGEYSGEFPQVDRLVRDFDINSPTDLARAQQANPDRYGATEDMSLNYLPVASSHAIAELAPILSRGGKKVSIVAASQLNSDVFRTNDVVYVGLVSGMGMLEEMSFMNSNFAVGANYDQLVNLALDRTYVSGEALNLSSSRYYTDYGYLSVFREPGGALVAVVAGARDTGLRGVADASTALELPAELERVAGNQSVHGYEALFEITGQQGADLSEELVAALPRP